MQPDRHRVSDERSPTHPAGATAGALPGGDVTVDELSDASFPASDPPSTWTWEVRVPAQTQGGGSDDVTVRDDPERGRYEALVGLSLAGHLDYHAQPGLVTALHTEVDPAFEGRGVGSELVRRLLDDVRGRDARVLPVCPFVRAYVQRHPEYADLVWTA